MATVEALKDKKDIGLLKTVLKQQSISKWFPDFRRKYKLPDVTFHGLRHTADSSY